MVFPGMNVAPVCAAMLLRERCRGQAAKEKPTKEKRRSRSPAFSKDPKSERLTLRELEGPAGLGLAVLLTLDDTAVAGQEATLLEYGAQARLKIGEGLRDSVKNGTGLTGETAAGN